MELPVTPLPGPTLKCGQGTPTSWGEAPGGVTCFEPLKRSEKTLVGRPKHSVSVIYYPLGGLRRRRPQMGQDGRTYGSG